MIMNPNLYFFMCNNYGVVCLCVSIHKSVWLIVFCFAITINEIQLESGMQKQKKSKNETEIFGK